MMHEQKPIRRIVRFGAFCCALLAVLLCPFVLEQLAIPDGTIEDTTTRLLLTLAAISMGIVCFTLMWMANSRSPRAKSAFLEFGSRLQACWSWRYWFVALVLGACFLARIAFDCYVYRVNHVDLLARLDPEHNLGQKFLTIAEHDGSSSAIMALVRHQQTRSPTARFTPYQVWNTEPSTSAVRRRNFLAGDIGKAANLHDPVRWRAGDPIPYGDHQDVARTFALQCQTFLFDILRDKTTPEHKKALTAANAFVTEWRNTNRVWPNSVRFSWNDHATAERLVAHMLLMDQRRAQGLTSEDEEGAFLKSMLQHADQLVRDASYNADTNHGMMQNAALLAVALGYPEFDKNDNWLRTALSRTEQYASAAFTEAGVCLELTPEYHWFNTQLLLWFVATCHREQIDIDPSLERTTRGAIKFCRELLQPDRSIPIIADTYGNRHTLENWPLSELPDWPELEALRAATMESGQLPNVPGARLWPESGYFILRSGAPHWTADEALMLVLKTNSKSRAHSHRDALSISLYGNGRPLLSGPGFPSYGFDIDRSEVLATTNQNTVSVDGLSQELGNAPVSFYEIEPEILSEGSNNELAIVQAAAELYPGVQHRRTLLYGPDRSDILVVDELLSDSEHEYRQHFRISPGLVAMVEAADIRVTSNDEEKTLLKISSSVLSDDGLEIPGIESDGSLSSFCVRGRCRTFVTLLKLENSSSSPPLEFNEQLVRWHGREGTLELKLPLTHRSEYHWTPSAIAQIQRGKDSNPQQNSDIPLKPSNAPPQASDDSFSTDKGTPLQVGSSSGVLVNDTDNEGNSLHAILVEIPSHGKVDFHADGSFTYSPHRDFVGTDSFEYKANDGTADSNLATVEITIQNPRATWTESFEGSTPRGWNSSIWSSTNFGNNYSVTTDEITPPPGGGRFVYRQGWIGGSGFNVHRPNWLRYQFKSSETEEGDVVEFEYYLKYHEQFNFNSTYHKMIIMRGVNGALQELLIDAYAPNGKMFAVFPLVGSGDLYSNINGGHYSISKGEWSHYRWRVKISTASNGNPKNGYLYGWVNGTKRWEYNNINTIRTGRYAELNLNSTFNEPLTGPNQKRYWDLISVRSIEE